MKKLILTLIIFFCASITFAQFGNLGKKIENKVKTRTDRKVDQTIDKGLDEVENIPNEDNTPDEDVNEPIVNNEPAAPDISENDAPVAKTKAVLWSKYDFIPGDKIIFEDNLQSEELGEFPSRWDLHSGNVEIARFGEEKVINLVDHGSEIFPLMNKENWLPEIFTVEFDAYYTSPYDYYEIRLWNPGTGHNNEVNGELEYIYIYPFRAYMGSKGTQLDEDPEKNSDTWKHIALAFNKRSLKLYLDENRMINIPNVGGKPTGLSIVTRKKSESKAMIKNIRIAEGGKKIYDRVMSEGKIITHGITFEVNKAVIKPESMGTINEIAKLMKENADINFSIEGHTDSDGAEDANQSLSEKRAEAVMHAMVEAGVDASRLTSKGWGETMPMDANETPEGKANNRRVEFLKI